MLKENPKSRPNIYQVLREACLMQGIEIPIKDVSSISILQRSITHYGRFMPEGHSRNRGGTSNCHHQNLRLHHYRLLVRYSRRLHSNSKLFPRLCLCEGEDHKEARKAMLQNQAHLRCGELQAIPSQHWT